MISAVMSKWASQYGAMSFKNSPSKTPQPPGIWLNDAARWAITKIDKKWGIVISAFPEMIEDSMIADAVATLGSLNIIAGELDR